MPLDFEAMRAEQRRVQSMTHRGIRNWDLKENSQNRGRLLPPWPGAPAIGFMSFKHFHTFMDPKVTSCYEQMYPTSQFKCPICSVITKLSQQGVDANRMGAECHPCMNVIDRLTPNQDYNPFFWEARVTPYNALMSIALNNQIELTSTDIGYDFIVVPKTTTTNSRTRTTYEVQIVPGAPTPLVPPGVDVNLGKKWVESAYNIPSMFKMPDWNSDDGRKEWQRLMSAAQGIERYYANAMSGAAMVQGFTPPAPTPQFAPPAPQFGAPTAQPPQFAPPPPQFAPPAPQFGAPPPSPFPAPQPVQGQYAPPPQFAPPPTPHQMTTPMQQTPPPQFTTPVPQPPPSPFPAPQPVQGQYAPPQQSPSGPTPPWETPAPQVQAPYQPQAPQPAPQPSYQPPQSAPQPAPAPQPSVQSGPSMVNSSVDQVPQCYGKSWKDQTVSYKNIAGGWNDSDQDPHRAMRCSTCPHEMSCKSAALQNYPTDYVS